MLVIDVPNVNVAWNDAKQYLNKHGILRPSRVGEVLEYPEPVTTRYRYPKERVLFDPKRDANPVFHFFESLWMLAGKNDVSWISQFNQRMMSFSDDGVVYHAAYGHRWRHHFGQDQFNYIIWMLKNDPNERRAVLQMWDPRVDLGRQGKDFPCNTSVYFKIRKSKLTMTVSNRSNDIVWGCYGANVVHMSVLQEYLAANIGVEVGEYYQISDSWHAYTEYWGKYAGDVAYSAPLDYYHSELCEPFQLVRDPVSFDFELASWIQSPSAVRQYENPIFPDVAMPMYLAWWYYKRKDFGAALEHATTIAATDWRLAVLNWLLRRQTNHERTAANCS